MHFITTLYKMLIVGDMELLKITALWSDEYVLNLNLYLSSKVLLIYQKHYVILMFGLIVGRCAAAKLFQRKAVGSCYACIRHLGAYHFEWFAN